MASSIDPTKPVDGVAAVKADLRANLASAKTDIEALQTSTAALQANFTQAGVLEIPTPATGDKVLGLTAAGLYRKYDVSNLPAAAGGGGGGSAAALGVAIESFGADPTGVANSAPALQAAANSGQPLIFFKPGGTYKAQSQVNLASNQTWWGYGATIFRQGEDNTQAVLYADNKVNVKLFGLTIDGGRSTTTTYDPAPAGAGLRLQHSGGVIKDCYIKNCMGDGLMQHAGPTPVTAYPHIDLQILDSTFELCRRAGLSINQPGYVVVSNCRFYDMMGGGGIDMECDGAQGSGGHVAFYDIFLGTKQTTPTMRQAIGAIRADIGQNGNTPTPQLYTYEVHGLSIIDYWPPGTLPAGGWPNQATNLYIGNDGLSDRTQGVVDNVYIWTNVVTNPANNGLKMASVTGRCDIKNMRLVSEGSCEFGITFDNYYNSQVDLTIEGSFREAVWFANGTGPCRNIDFKVTIDKKGNTGGDFGGAALSIINSNNIRGSGRLIGGAACGVRLDGATNVSVGPWDNGSTNLDVLFQNTNDAITFKDFKTNAALNTLRTSGTLPAHWVEWNVNDGQSMRIADATGSQAAASSGRVWNVTGNLTGVKTLVNWSAEYINTSGTSKTLTTDGAGAIQMDTGTTGTTVTLLNNRSCRVRGTGTQLLVTGGATVA